MKDFEMVVGTIDAYAISDFVKNLIILCAGRSLKWNIVTVADADIRIRDAEFLLCFEIEVLQRALGERAAVFIRAVFDRHAVEPVFTDDARREYTAAGNAEVTDT